MEYKTFQTKVIEVENDRTVVGIASVFGVIDSGGDRIWKGAFKKTIAERSNRFRHLWQHDFSQPPIAAIKEVREIGKGELPNDLKQEYPDATGGVLIKREYLDTLRGNEVLAGIKADAINEMSIGYDPIKWDIEEIKDGDLKGMLVRNLREIRNWDFSDVNWGMAEQTRANIKSVLPFKDTGTKDLDAPWNVPQLSDFTDEEDFESLSEAEKNRIAAHFAWSKNTPPQAFEDLQIPHHEPRKEGVGPAIWSGVEAGLKSLVTHEPGSPIPAKDLKALHIHLKEHAAQYGQEVPPYKKVNLIWTVDDLIKGSEDMPDVFEQLSVLANLLRAEPQPEPEIDLELVLTQKSEMARNLELRQRALSLY